MSDGIKITLRCDRITPGVPNLNKRIYTQETIQKMVDRINEIGPDQRMLGQIGQSYDGKTRLSEASHFVLGAQCDELGISGEIELLDTENGKKLASMLVSNADGYELVPRGIGTVVDGVVGSDYKILSMDVVPVLTDEDRARGRVKEVTSD